MKIFVTGARGYVGSAIVRELLASGHQVLGLVRSETQAAPLAAAGAEVLHGSLEDLDSLRRGAAAADGVIHTAFIHDFANLAQSAQVDLRAIETIGAVLEGSGKPFVITSGILMLTFLLPRGRIGTEKDVAEAGSTIPRIASELAVIAMAERGVRSSVVRLPPTVHGEGDHGFVPTLINIAHAKGVSAYPGDGTNRWPAVHRLDAANLFRLAVEKAPAGSVLHAVADEGVPVRDIADVIGRRLDIPVASLPPEKANEHFGFLGDFFSMDAPSSSALTRQWLGWRPVHADLLTDLNGDYYFSDTAHSKYH
ncbi:MAG TPA: SDR family oxidoreductase [Ktedonobacteraceae bacterium]|nr:SDR family oxidoreductase [Ktedonobacteraceae bacterium]